MLEDNLIDFSSDFNSVISSSTFKCSGFKSNKESFYKTITQKYSLNDEEFHLFHSEELAILTFFQYIKRDYITLYTPIPQFYYDLCQKYGATIDTIDYIDNFDRDIKQNSIVIFTNPSLADGNYYDLESHLEAWNKKNVIILLIETSLKYTNRNSSIPLLSKYPNLFILKNMAKFYGLDMIDTSIIFSKKNNIENMQKYTPNSTITQFEMENISHVIDDETFYKTFKVINTKNNIFLENILNNSSFINKVYSSNSNIIMVEMDHEKYKILKKYLSNYGIIIESNILRYKKNKYIRFCVKSKNSLLHLKKILEQLEQEQ